MEQAALASALTLHPGQWTAIPGTNLVVLWLGAGSPATITRAGGLWDLGELAVPGRIVAWVAFANRPEVPPWPIVPVTRRSVYRSRGADPALTTRQFARHVVPPTSR